MALDHSRLRLENKFLESKSGRIVLRSTSLLYKILPTYLGACRPTFYTFNKSHLRWNSTMRRCFLSYRPRTECSVSQFCNTNCTHKNIQERWKHAWTFSETVKNISKITYTASRYSLWQAPNEWTITELRFHIIKNLLCLFFIYWFYNWMCKLQKRLCARILSTPASDVHERLKTNCTAIKIAKEATNNQ